jgi:hypothetical protein
VGAIDAINEVWDRIDEGIAVVAHVFDRYKQTETRVQHFTRTVDNAEVVDAEIVNEPTTTTPPPSTRSSRSSKRAAAKQAKQTQTQPATQTLRSPFYLARRDGIYIVTDGKNATAECPSREAAVQLLELLQKMGPSR